MPYLKKEQKQYFSEVLVQLHRCSIANSGELNYLIAELINQYHDTNPKNYANMAQVISALELAKYEYERRVVAPYEEVKILENGEVYSKEVLK